jgi:hypothetical protein
MPADSESGTGGEYHLEHSLSHNNQGKGGKEFVIKKMTRNPSNHMLPKNSGLINIYNINNGASSALGVP